MKGKFLFVILELLLILALVLAACGPAAAPEGDPPSLANAPEEPDAVQAAPEAGAYSITEPYRDYPDIDTLFSSYSTNEERLAACQIPEEILPNMTTEALVETIFLHPLRWTLYWNTNWTEGKVMLDWMESSFNAVPELYSRADGIAVLEGWTQEKEAQYEAEESYEQYIDLRIGQALLAEMQIRAAGFFVRTLSTASSMHPFVPPINTASGGGRCVSASGARPSTSVRFQAQNRSRFWAINSQASGAHSTANTCPRSARRASSTDTLPVPAPTSHTVSSARTASFPSIAARTSCLVMGTLPRINWSSAIPGAKVSRGAASASRTERG